MELTKKYTRKLKNVDIVKATRNAREETSRLLNDQGFTVLSLAISNFIADIAEHPEKVVKEFVH
jgi:hypothetical protein